ncbi:Ubiquitin carboxyl-terminal hydrolase family protein [Quillaja saponaria]|uniref:Ubiquitin carboxyl-terminal hydrolase family protein n=1 Tax=Quillaja saponaria TaxID=32244 RepID=A0AAD7LBS8_QUISA|nr:Ubiquitin carboxyl-terminal hydrolase family protein [Quillaja saponaria]
MGYVPELFIPLLEEVCTRYPSLIESQLRRSRFYAACAFTALGRILHFLDTTKIGHVNGDVCKCLRLLWDEVQSFSFDLSWLAPQVEFALSMKVYMERVGMVQKLEDDVRMLKMKIRKLNKGLVEATKELAYAKGDLVQTSAELGEHVHTEEVLGYRRQIKESL